MGGSPSGLATWTTAPPSSLSSSGEVPAGPRPCRDVTPGGASSAVRPSPTRAFPDRGRYPVGGKARTGAGRRRAGRAARAGALPGACAHRPAPAGPRPAPGWPTCRPGARGPPPSPGERLPGAAAAAVLAVIRPTPPGAAGRSRTAVLVIMPSLLVPLGRSAPSRTRTSRSGGMTWRVGAGRVRRPSMTRRDASAAPRSCWSSRGQIDPHVPPSRHAPPGARLFLCAGGPKPAQRGPLPVPQRRRDGRADPTSPSAPVGRVVPPAGA